MSWSPTSADREGVRFWMGVALKAQANREAADMPPDFAAWIGHLFWLHAALSAEVMTAAELKQDESEGLVLLDQLSRELAGRLVRCPSCQAFSEKGLACTACGRPLQKSVA